MGSSKFFDEPRDGWMRIKRPIFTFRHEYVYRTTHVDSSSSWIHHDDRILFKRPIQVVQVPPRWPNGHQTTHTSYSSSFTMTESLSRMRDPCRFFKFLDAYRWSNAYWTTVHSTILPHGDSSRWPNAYRTTHTDSFKFLDAPRWLASSGLPTLRMIECLSEVILTKGTTREGYKSF